MNTPEQTPAATPVGVEVLRARHWETLAARTRLASSGAEMRTLHPDGRLESYHGGPAEVPLDQLEILERGRLTSSPAARSAGR